MPVQICQQNWIVISACRKIIQALVNFTNSKLAYQSFGHSNRYYSYEAVFFLLGEHYAPIPVILQVTFKDNEAVSQHQ